MIQLLKTTAEYDIRREAVWAIANATIGGTSAQVEYLVRLNCIAEFYELLRREESLVWSIIFDAFNNILRHDKFNYGTILRSMNKGYIEEIANGASDVASTKAFDLLNELYKPV